MAKQVKIRVSAEFLRRVIQFPVNTKIIRIQCTNKNEIIEMIVEHPDFRDLLSGELIPEIKPIYKQIQFDWNLDGKQ